MRAAVEGPPCPLNPYSIVPAGTGLGGHAWPTPREQTGGSLGLWGLQRALQGWTLQASPGHSLGSGCHPRMPFGHRAEMSVHAVELGEDKLARPGQMIPPLAGQ